MNTEIVPQVFSNPEFGEIRTANINNQPYFCAKDVAKALGYANTNDAIQRHCKGVVKRYPLQTKGGMQDFTFITEGDMYRLIASSKLKDAQRFESWIFDEVVPTIRKHGAYATPDTIERIVANPDFGIRLLSELKAEQEKRQALEAENSKQAAQIDEMRPKAFFAEAVTQSKTSVLVGVLAKLLKQNGYDTGQNRLFKKLCEDGYLIGTKGRNYHMPTQRAADMKLFEVKESTHLHADGHVSLDKTTLVTGKGQVYFINKYCGVQPLQ